MRLRKMSNISLNPAPAIANRAPSNLILFTKATLGNFSRFSRSREIRNFPLGCARFFLTYACFLRTCLAILLYCLGVRVADCGEISLCPLLLNGREPATLFFGNTTGVFLHPNKMNICFLEQNESPGRKRRTISCSNSFNSTATTGEPFVFDLSHHYYYIYFFIMLINLSRFLSIFQNGDRSSAKSAGTINFSPRLRSRSSPKPNGKPSSIFSANMEISAS